MNAKLQEDLTQLQTLITSVEADLSLGCLSTTPNDSITQRLQIINILAATIEATYNYNPNYLLTRSAYLTIAYRKYAPNTTVRQ